jgi:hypothetical protein
MKSREDRKAKQALRQLEFVRACASYGIPQPACEYKFLSSRRFCFDYAWPDLQIAIEQEGGIWIMGRHSRGSGFLKDAEKYNLAALAGWMVLRYTPQQIKAGLWVADFETAEAYRRGGERHGIHSLGQGSRDESPAG